LLLQAATSVVIQGVDSGEVNMAKYHSTPDCTAVCAVSSGTEWAQSKFVTRTRSLPAVPYGRRRRLSYYRRSLTGRPSSSNQHEPTQSDRRPEIEFLPSAAARSQSMTNVADVRPLAIASSHDGQMTAATSFQTCVDIDENDEYFEPTTSSAESDPPNTVVEDPSPPCCRQARPIMTATSSRTRRRLAVAQSDPVIRPFLAVVWGHLVTTAVDCVHQAAVGLVTLCPPWGGASPDAVSTRGRWVSWPSLCQYECRATVINLLFSTQQPQLVFRWTALYVNHSFYYPQMSTVDMSLFQQLFLVLREFIKIL